MLWVLMAVGCNRAPVGKGSGTGVIKRFGSYPLAGSSLELEISKRGASLVDFKVTDGPRGPAILSDSLGSDAMRWFIVWDPSGVLWVYGSDTGYFKRFEFPPGAAPVTLEVPKGMPLPGQVRSELPGSLRARHPLRP